MQADEILPLYCSISRQEQILSCVRQVGTTAGLEVLGGGKNLVFQSGTETLTVQSAA